MMGDLKANIRRVIFENGQIVLYLSQLWCLYSQNHKFSLMECNYISNKVNTMAIATKFNTFENTTFNIDNK